jgi:hypothetical protein
MGVYLKREIITGAFFTKSDLGKDFVKNYFMVDNEKTFGGKVKLFELNPYGGETIHKDYIIGVLDKTEDNGERAEENAKEILQEVELNLESYNLVKEQLEKSHLLDDSHPIKTYRLQYFV